MNAASSVKTTSSIIKTISSPTVSPILKTTSTPSYSLPPYTAPPGSPHAKKALTRKQISMTPAVTTPPMSFIVPPCLQYISGDCDGDCFVTILDAYLASQVAAGLATLDEMQFRACNVEGILGGPDVPGAQISVADSLVIAQFVSGLLSSIQSIVEAPIFFQHWEFLGPWPNGTGINVSIIKMNTDGSNQVSIKNDDWTSYYDFTISPDGSKIAYTYYGPYNATDNASHIYVMDSDGQNDVQITFGNNIYDYAPTWSPNGTRIAYGSNKDGRYEIYTMNIDGSNDVRVTNSVDDEDWPTWSPRENKIMYELDPAGDWDHTQIFTVNPDGTNVIQLTNSSLDNEWSSWSPDGSRILFTLRNLTSGGFVYIMDSDGSNPRLIAPSISPVTSGLYIGDEFWGRNGLIYFGGDFANMYSIDEFGNNLLQYTNDTLPSILNWWPTQ